MNARKVVTVSWIVALLAGTAQLRAGQNQGKRYPKLAPFSAARWKEATPEVKVKDTWYELLAINDTEAKEIVRFCKDRDEKDWQKRFEEDLVEMMGRMGHEPSEKVTLKVRDLQTGQMEILKDVPNTHENRQALWQARNQGR